MTPSRQLLVLTILAFSTALAAQVKDTGFSFGSDFRSGVYYQTWSREGDRISQWSFPITYVLPLSRKATLDFTSGLAFASRAISASTLDGLKDTRMRLSYLTMRDRVLLSAFLTFPTGVSRLKGDQNEVASALADDALDFRVPNFGQGYRLNISGVLAKEINRNLVIGGGVAFLMRGGFQPFADRDFEYRPGNELALTFGIDVGGSIFKITTDVSYVLYQADKTSHGQWFKSGDQLLLQLRWVYNPQPFGLTFYLQNRTKGRNERGLGSLAGEVLNANGNQLDAGGIISNALNDRTVLNVLLSAKIYRKNEFGEREALVLGVGGGFLHRFSRRMSVEASARFSKGKQKAIDGSIAITGVEIGGGVRYRL